MQTATGHQATEDRRLISGFRMPDEKPVTAAEGTRPDSVFDEIRIEPSGVGILRSFPRNPLPPLAKMPPQVGIVPRLPRAELRRPSDSVHLWRREREAEVVFVKLRLHGVGTRKDGQLHSTMPPPSFIRSTSEGPRFCLSSYRVRLQVRIVSDMSL